METENNLLFKENIINRKKNQHIFKILYSYSTEKRLFSKTTLTLLDSLDAASKAIVYPDQVLFGHVDHHAHDNSFHCLCYCDHLVNLPLDDDREGFFQMS